MGLVTIDVRDKTPIYAQLERGLRAAIAAGRLQTGDQLPTVRQLAVELKVNANTVARVYSDLQRAGVLETRRGDVMRRPASTFTTLAAGRTPVLLIWGTSDHTVPFSRSDTVRAAFARAEFHAIDSAAHLPQIERAPVVDSLVVQFLRAH